MIRSSLDRGKTPDLRPRHGWLKGGAMNKKVAIVTGGSNGIGKSTALELAKRGTGVILTYKSDKKGADALVLEIEQQSAARAAAMKLDLSQKSSFKDFAHLAKNTLDEIWGRKTFDYLVNNGGIGGGMMFTEVTEDYFNQIFDTNFRGAIFLNARISHVHGRWRCYCEYLKHIEQNCSSGIFSVRSIEGGIVILDALSGQRIRVTTDTRERSFPRSDSQQYRKRSLR